MLMVLGVTQRRSALLLATNGTQERGDGIQGEMAGDAWAAAEQQLVAFELNTLYSSWKTVLIGMNFFAFCVLYQNGGRFVWKRNAFCIKMEGVSIQNAKGKLSKAMIRLPKRKGIGKN